MFDTKVILTIIGLLVAVAICKKNSNIKEGFWGVSAPRTVKVVREIHPAGHGGCGIGATAVQNNYQSMLGSRRFVQVPSYQGILSPRFDNNSYGAHIRYNPPAYENQAAPCDPLAFGDMASAKYVNKAMRGGDCVSGGCGSSLEHFEGPGSREEFVNSGCKGGGCGKGGGCSGGCGFPDCGSGISLSSPSVISSECPNYINAMNNAYDGMSGPVPSDLVPVSDMTTLGADGAVNQPIVYDRFMFANQKSRLRAQGDPIRGDLPIAPCNNGWFNVAVNPHIDLHEGAMNVIGGADNGTARALGELNFAASGGTETINSGVNMSNYHNTRLGAGMCDISVSAFA